MGIKGLQYNALTLSILVLYCSVNAKRCWRFIELWTLEQEKFAVPRVAFAGLKLIRNVLLAFLYGASPLSRNFCFLCVKQTTKNIDIVARVHHLIVELWKIYNTKSGVSKCWFCDGILLPSLPPLPSPPFPSHSSLPFPSVSIFPPFPSPSLLLLLKRRPGSSPGKFLKCMLRCYSWVLAHFWRK